MPNLAGFEINDFKSVKAVVVARPKGQTVVVDKPGISATSSIDKNVKIFIPRNAFSSRTLVNLLV